MSRIHQEYEMYKIRKKQNMFVMCQIINVFIYQLLSTYTYWLLSSQFLKTINIQSILYIKLLPVKLQFMLAAVYLIGSTQANSHKTSITICTPYTANTEPPLSYFTFSQCPNYRQLVRLLYIEHSCVGIFALSRKRYPHHIT